MDDKMNMDDSKVILLVVLCVFAIGGLIGGGCYIQPRYNVYSQEKEGEAEYARADANRRIAVLEAQAKFEAAKSLALAEIERAKGVAEANKIIGTSLKDNESYLRYLWITDLKAPNSTVIYVPTEANIPILEAGKRP